MFFQTFVGQTGMRGKSSGHHPRAASVQTRADGGVNVRTKFEKVLDLGKGFQEQDTYLFEESASHVLQMSEVPEIGQSE